MSKPVCVKQHDSTDCGPACLASILRYYKSNVSLAVIRDHCGTDRNGSTVYGMVKAAEKLGFHAKAARGSRETLSTELLLPAIAHLSFDGTIHYVVIYKIEDGVITAADPAEGIVEYDIDSFLKKWSGILIFLGPSDEFTRNKKGSSFTRFLKLLLPQKALIIKVFLLSLIVTGFGIAASYYFMILMNRVIPAGDSGLLHALSLCVILLTLVRAALEFLRNRLLVRLSQSLDIPLILGFYKHVLDLPVKFFATRKIGEIVSRFGDASKIREAISGATLTIMIDTIMAAVGGVVLYIQSPILFCIAVAVLVLSAVIIVLFKKPLEKNNEEQMESNSQLTSYLVEGLNGIETVKAFNAEEAIHAKTTDYFKRFLRSISKGAMLNSGQKSLTAVIYALGVNIIIWIGAIFVLHGKYTFGELITFNALLAYFIDPVQNLIGLQPMMQTAVVASERLAEIMDLEVEQIKRSGPNAPAGLNGRIEIENVSFRYGMRRLVLKGVNLSIAPGEKVALVGESGSGKSTLAKLLLNFYQFEEGSISYGGVDINDIDLDFLRNRIAYIPQEIRIFSGSIKDNLLLGSTDVTEEDLIAACENSRAMEFISSFATGFDTMLNENGSNLSGGQKQRLAIARAILKKPDILILDEATSNLDVVTEKAIHDAIYSTFKNVTTIIIAHRLSTIRRCDRICVMSDGAVIEEGSHEELLEKKGSYYSMWREQS